MYIHVYEMILVESMSFSVKVCLMFHGAFIEGH